MEKLTLYTGRPTDLSGRMTKEIESDDFWDRLPINYVRVEHEAIIVKLGANEE